MDQFNENSAGGAQKVIIGVLVLAVLGVGAYLIFGGTDMTPPTQEEIQTGGITQEEKQEIVNAVLNQQKIYASKDVKQIKDYLLNLEITPEGKKDIQTMSSTKVLAIAAGSSIYATTTAEDLLGTQATWNVATDIAVIRIPKGEKTAVFTVQRINGTWY
jgi:hypothetical protein